MISTLSLRDRLFHRLQQNNPFYFLSAACMLAGCLAVTNSLSWTSIPISRLLVLILTLQIYEAVLIVLAAYLIRVRHVARDGIVLLALEAFFLIDITFLNAEIATSYPSLGILVNLVLFLTAVAKLAVIVALVGQSPLDGRFAAMALQLAVLFAIPVLFRHVDHGQLSPRVFYGAWWAIGLLIPLSVEISRSSGAPTIGWGRQMIVLLMALPSASLMLHLGILHYVYDVTFYGADAAPVLLGLAFVLFEAYRRAEIPRRDLAVLAALLPAAAVLVSANSPLPLCFIVSRHPAFVATPFALAIAGAYITYVWMFLRPYALLLLATGSLLIPGWIYNRALAGMTRTALIRGGNFISDAVDYLLTRTTLYWGVTAIAAAFAFLGMGAAVSLARRIHLPPPPSAEPLDSTT